MAIFAPAYTRLRIFEKYGMLFLHPIDTPEKENRTNV